MGAEQEDRKTEDGGHSDDLLVDDKLGAEAFAPEKEWKQSGEGVVEQTLEISLNDIPADSQLFDVLHSEANASFGICLDVSNELFETTVDLLERDLKRSASKEAPPKASEAGESDNHSGKKPRSGNKENVCQQLLTMSLKANESKEKKNGEKKKLGTYKGLIVRNRTINAESDDDSPKEEAPSMNVVVEKAFLVTRVTKKDNVVKTNKVTRTLMSNTNRPWKRA